MITVNFPGGNMRYKKAVSAALAVLFAVMSLSVYAAEPNAYSELAAEEPVYQRELTLAELEEYYSAASTDEILDPAECNYIYGEVSVGGVTELCHVYMRTFVIKEIADSSQAGLEALAKRIVSFVKKSAASKYIKCIARTYNARISKVVKNADDTVTSITVKIFIACGEKTEDRAALREGYVAGIVAELEPLSDGERFIRLNELMLDGRFKYDMTYRHRCSSVALVNEGMGVCEEYAGFTSLVLDGLGYENSIITGEAGGIPHMWNLVVIDGRTYHLDILHDGPVNELGEHTEVLRRYLLVSENTVKDTHIIADTYAEQSEKALYDYVFDGYPTEIAGAFELNGEKYVYAEKYNMTSEELCEQFGAAGFMTVTKSDEPVEGETAAGSGCLLSLAVNGKTIDTCRLVVRGDLTGSGATEDEDAALLTEYLLGDLDGVSDLFILAADLDGNGLLTVTDLIMAADIAEGRIKDEEQGGEEEETTDTETEPEESAEEPV